MVSWRKSLQDNSIGGSERQKRIRGRPGKEEGWEKAGSLSFIHLERNFYGRLRGRGKNGADLLELGAGTLEIPMLGRLRRVSAIIVSFCVINTLPAIRIASKTWKRRVTLFRDASTRRCRHNRFLERPSARAKSLMTMPKNANDHPRGLLADSPCVPGQRFGFTLRQWHKGISHPCDPSSFLSTFSFSIISNPPRRRVDAKLS